MQSRLFHYIVYDVPPANKKVHNAHYIPKPSDNACMLLLCSCNVDETALSHPLLMQRQQSDMACARPATAAVTADRRPL